MRSLLVAVVAFAAVSALAHSAAISVEANGGEQDFAKALTTTSGKKVRVGFFGTINPDCTEYPGTIGRILDAPSHGVLSLVHGKDYNVFGGVTEHCTYRRVGGLDVYYQSQRGYVGPDTFIFDVFFPKGGMFHTIVNIDVK